MLLATMIVHTGSKSHPERVLFPDSLPPSTSTLLSQKLDHIIVSYETRSLPVEIEDEIDQLEMGCMMAKWSSGVVKREMMPSEVLKIAQENQKKSYYNCGGGLHGWSGCVRGAPLLRCGKVRPLLSLA